MEVICITVARGTNTTTTTTTTTTRNSSRFTINIGSVVLQIYSSWD